MIASFLNVVDLVGQAEAEDHGVDARRGELRRGAVADHGEPEGGEPHLLGTLSIATFGVGPAGLRLRSRLAKPAVDEPDRRPVDDPFDTEPLQPGQPLLRAGGWGRGPARPQSPASAPRRGKQMLPSSSSSV